MMKLGKLFLILFCMVLTISAGTISVRASDAASKALATGGNMNISGGTLTLVTTGNAFMIRMIVTYPLPQG